MRERARLTAKKPEAKRRNLVFQKQKTDFSHSISSPIDHILTLQRTIGNQAVQRLFKSGVIQAKLKIGQPNDIYEQEADRVAEQVMRMPEPCLQRQTEEEEEEEEIIQTKPLADQITPFVQRQVEQEEEEKILHAKEVPGQTSEVTHELESRINALKGGGRPLTECERNFFEPRFNYDFSDVRIHTEIEAAQRADNFDAQAFTYANEIVFGNEKYSPETIEGKKLIGHELTHVMQQNKGTSNPSMIVQRRSRSGRRGPGARPIPSIVPPPDVIRNLKNLIQGRGGGKGRRRRGGSLPPEFESRWKRREAETIKTRVGIHIQIINNYHRVSGVSGTVGKAKTPAQAVAGALKFIMEGAAVVSKIPEDTESLVVLTDLKKAYLPVIDDWMSLLPESEYQLYTIVYTNPVLVYEIPVAITTNKHLAKEILKEMGEPEWYSIKPYGKIWGQVILPTPEGPEYPMIKPANE